MHKYIWLVPLLPLAGAAINGVSAVGFGFPLSNKMLVAVATADGAELRSYCNGAGK